MGEWIHIFLTSALVGVERSALRLGLFIPKEGALDNHWIGGWVGLRTGLNDVERRNILPLPKFDPSAVQPVACCYNDLSSLLTADRIRYMIYCTYLTALRQKLNALNYATY
jgi:hypothetical protein